MIKIGKESNFTRGIYEGRIAAVITKNSKKEQSKRNNVVAISALGMNDTAFAEDGDSGSIYYASRGSFRYPFAIQAMKKCKFPQRVYSMSLKITSLL